MDLSMDWNTTRTTTAGITRIQQSTMSAKLIEIAIMTGQCDSNPPIVATVSRRMMTMKSSQNSPLHLSTGISNSHLEYDESNTQQVIHFFFVLDLFSIERTSTSPSKTPIINPLLYIIGKSFFLERSCLQWIDVDPPRLTQSSAIISNWWFSSVLPCLYVVHGISFSSFPFSLTGQYLSSISHNNQSLSELKRWIEIKVQGSWRYCWVVQMSVSPVSP